MRDKKRYYKLDELGVIGSQTKKPVSAVRRERKKIGAAIRAFKISKSVSSKGFTHQ